MRFSVLLVRGLLRRPVRSFLTASAMAIAVAAVVALVGIAYGFETSFMASFRTAGIDLVVIRAGQHDRLKSTLDGDLARPLAAIPGVLSVSPSLMELVSFEDQGLMAVGVRGVEPHSRVLDGMRVIAGRPLAEGDKRAVVLGDLVAQSLKLKVGNQLPLYGEPYEVVGIHHADSSVDNGAILVPLAQLQMAVGRPNQVTGFTLEAARPNEPGEIERMAAAVERVAPMVAALTTRDHVSSIAQIRAARNMAWVTSFIGLTVGAIGVLNTMFMSVYERRREIGVLRAVGWHKGRVVAMIVGESLLLSLAGAAAGSLVAVALTKLLSAMPAANGMIEGHVAWQAIGEGFALALAIALIGAAYPAYRSARLTPCDALRAD